MAVRQLHDHPYRDAIIAELHARPVELVEGATRVRRLVFVVAPQGGAMREAIARFHRFAETAGIALPEDATRQYGFERDGKHVTWEFHTEFITLTWTAPLDDGTPWPDDIGLDALGDAQLVGAVRVDVLDTDTVPAHLLPGFHQTSLCVVSVESGQAQLATDFTPDRDRFIRFEFAAAGLSPMRRAITLRRLLEVETYRTMALIGLPLAREVSPILRDAENELTEIFESLSEADTAERVQTALDGLQALSVRSGQLSERLNYRFAATRAYGEVLRRRLEKLRETTIGHGSSLSSFIGNRVEPALATCEAVDKRLSVLARKIERGISLLNVRIGLDMQIQNKSVLETIAQTAKSQFRLQRTVEGLSTIAISYYFLGILSYLLAGPLKMVHFDKTMALSISAPFVVLLVWLAIRAIRKSHD